MTKFFMLKAIIENPNLTNESKAKQLEKALNHAIKLVVSDFCSELKIKGLLTDLHKAETARDIILGQTTLSDYPNLQSG